MTSTATETSGTGAPTTADVIDLLAGGSTSAADAATIAHLRRLRPQARENAQRSFESLLEPADAGEFPLAERYAVATFAALLHRAPEASAFYLDLLREESLTWADAVVEAATRAAGVGPFGVYREPDLAAESTLGTTWTPGPGLVSQFGAHLAAALAHSHLLVLRPREARAADLRSLEAAGWEADGIVTLSQLVAFLSFQLRLTWGLRVLAGLPTSATDAAAFPGPVSAPGTAPVGLVSEGGTEPDIDRPQHFTQDSLGWVPWIDPVPREDLTAEQDAALLDDFRRSAPYFRLLARDPAALVARTLTYKDIFFNTEGGVGRAERELAAAATSRTNGCVYCASVHSAAATRESGREADVQRLLDEGVGADLGDPVWNAVAGAAATLSATPLSFGPPQVDTLREAGLEDEAIVDVISGAAFFHWANRLMLSLGEPEIPARRKARS
jgi:alkylhydroperoxidase domain protein/CMD domain protein